MAPFNPYAKRSWRQQAAKSEPHEDRERVDGADDGPQADPIGDLFGVLAVADDVSADELVDGPTDSGQQQYPPESFSGLLAVTREQFSLTRSAHLNLSPRSYQTAALAAWERERGRGVVALPTGAGKTVVALMAIERVGLRTLVVAPTIDLLHQWRTALAEHLGYPLDAVGIVGGGKRTVRDLTVITYDSAAMPHRQLDGFGLLIVDEVHHLPARAYRTIARKVNAPFRLGLSATPERSDDGHLSFPELVGSIVYRRTAADLAADQHLATFDERRLFVNLDPDEQVQYDRLMTEYRWYLAAHRGLLGGGESMYMELIRRSGYDPAARSALRAHQQARTIALNADAKIAKVAALLAQHRDEKVIVFSEYNAMVDTLSERLLLPSITYRTPLAERRQVLDRFRSGAYTKLVTGRVLNEGVDVPDASVAIIVSGSSATREYVQRLGRILRPKRETAVLYELITRKTVEGRSARKRRPRTASSSVAKPASTT